MELKIDPDLMRPIIAEVVMEVWKALDEANRQAEDKIGFDEETAAGMLGIKEHVLRDERGRRRIRASKIVGGRIRYFRSDLVEYMIGREYGLSKNEAAEQVQSERDKPREKVRRVPK